MATLNATRTPRWAYVKSLLAKEISTLTAYCDRLIEAYPRPHDTGFLFEHIRCPAKQYLQPDESLPDCSTEREKRTVILLNGTFNHHFDIQGLLQGLRARLSRTSRLMVVAYNPYLEWLYRTANFLKLREGEAPSVFVTRTDLHNLCELAGFEVVRIRPAVYCPWRLLGLGSLINRLMPLIPGVRWLALVSILVIRPIMPETARKKPSLSIVIPARNERGNIEDALRRMPDLGAELEIVFVEGHSSDGTWEEIKRVQAEYGARFTIQAFQQTGKGKSDAVRLGFAKASGELLTILDADLTMPPELLGRFYAAYCEGHADFINGTRLVYPMEGDAMRFLNHLGNIFFATVSGLRSELIDGVPLTGCGSRIGGAAV